MKFQKKINKCFSTFYERACAHPEFMEITKLEMTTLYNSFEYWYTPHLTRESVEWLLGWLRVRSRNISQYTCGDYNFTKFHIW